MTKNSKKGKDVTKEVLKEDEKWYGLEKKFWSVVEFGVYVVLLTFTAIAIGAQYQSLEGNKNVIIDEDSKQMALEDMEGLSYLVDELCESEKCETTFTAQYKGKDLNIKYESNTAGTFLTIGDTKIESASPLREFALLSNGFIATVEDDEENTSLVRYYNNAGTEVHTFTTSLDITNDLASTKGVYSTCTVPERSTGNDHTLNIVEYEISEEGLFTENVIGSFENTNCED